MINEIFKKTVVHRMNKETIIVSLDKLVEIMHSNERFIYHYTSAEIARRYILPNGTLKFSNINHLNDPEECSKFDSLFLNNSGNVEKADSMSMLMYFKQTFPSLLFSSSFSTDKKDGKIYDGKNYYETIPLHVNKGFMLSRMWGTYGDKHKGVCLCFDKFKLLNSIENAVLQNFDIYQDDIKYSKDIIEYLNKFSKLKDYNSPASIYANCNTFSEFKDHIITHKDFFFFWKQNDWRDEKEFKIFLVNKNMELNSELYLPIGNSLSAIFMGHRFSVGVENEYFKYYCETHNINAFRTKFLGGTAYASPFNL